MSSTCPTPRRAGTRDLSADRTRGGPRRRGLPGACTLPMPVFPTSEIVEGAARSIAPRVSVFLFCRNRAGTIRRSVDSVLAQTYVDFEYVIQDGASTDGTLELLRQYG